MCFDKTGTLTEDDLDVLGLRVVHRPTMRYSLLMLEQHIFTDPIQIY